MDSPFQAICEAAAIEWSVPALAVGSSVGGSVSTVSVGCTPQTLFRAASVTKPFTALLALDLLDLEETTEVWPRDVRVRHLLSHTSGFACELGEDDLGRFGDGDDALARAVAALPGVTRYVGVEQAWSYANTGYWLVGRLAALRAGRSYEDALAERVIRPAGLESTSFGEPEVEGSGPESGAGPYPRARRPSGGLVSNVDDLLRFGRRLLELQDAKRLRIVHGKPTAGVYGLGLSGFRIHGVDVWGHDGSYGGFQSTLLVVPERDAVFVGLTNSGLGGKALYSISDEFFARVIGAKRRVRDSVELTRDALEGFTGSYAHSGGWYDVSLAPPGLLVTMDEGELSARAIGESTFEITHGDHIRERFDFPLEGFGRFGSRLAPRVA
jgi:CubicO group peptidase (beta-lactamase class C family)